MPAIFILFFVVLAVVLVCGGILSHRQQEERRAALSLLASELSWQFDPTRNYDHQHEFDQFSIFTSGKSRYGYNTMRGKLTIGEDAWPAQMGDYHYQTTSGTGKNRRTTTHLLSYVLVKLPYSTVPSLTVRREHLFDRMAGFLGFDDIDFESSEFSDRFHVKSPDKRFAYDVIHPRMMEFLLAVEPHTIDLQGGFCCVYASRQFQEAEQFREQVVWLQEFFSLWPSHVTSALQSEYS